MRRFCKEPKTFPQDILLILNPSVSVPAGFSFAPSCSRSFFLNCRLPTLPHLLNPALPPVLQHGRASRFPALAASTYYLSVPVRCVPDYLSRLLSTVPRSKEKERRTGCVLKRDACCKYNRAKSDKHRVRSIRGIMRHIPNRVFCYDLHHSYPLSRIIIGISYGSRSELQTTIMSDDNRYVSLLRSATRTIS